MSLMGFLNKIYNRLLFLRMTRRVKKLPPEMQRAISQKVYAEGYEAFRKLHDAGAVYGACSVIFECDYEGHVSYYIERELSKRESDPTDPTVYYRVRRIEGSKREWIATAVVSMDSDENAMMAADASVMSAVLSAKTAEGKFRRYMSVVKFDPTAEGVSREKVLTELEDIHGALLGLAKVAHSASSN